MITQEQFDLEKRLSEITGKVVYYKNSLAQSKKEVQTKTEFTISECEQTQEEYKRSLFYYKWWGADVKVSLEEWMKGKGSHQADIKSGD